MCYSPVCLSSSSRNTSGWELINSCITLYMTDYNSGLIFVNYHRLISGNGSPIFFSMMSADFWVITSCSSEKPVYKTEITAVGDQPHWPCDTPLSAKVATNFADKWRLLCRYSSLTELVRRRPGDTLPPSSVGFPLCLLRTTRSYNS
jgi:hypothetical protein